MTGAIACSQQSTIAHYDISVRLDSLLAASPKHRDAWQKSCLNHPNLNNPANPKV